MLAHIDIISLSLSLCLQMRGAAVRSSSPIFRPREATCVCNTLPHKPSGFFLIFFSFVDRDNIVTESAEHVESHERRSGARDPRRCNNTHRGIGGGAPGFLGAAGGAFTASCSAGGVLGGVLDFFFFGGGGGGAT